MTLSELTTQLATHQGLSKAAASEHLRALVEILRETLADGETLKLPGLGSFSLATIAARSGTVAGRPYHSEARPTVRFRPAASLVERIAERQAQR